MNRNLLNVLRDLTRHLGSLPHHLEQQKEIINEALI